MLIGRRVIDLGRRGVEIQLWVLYKLYEDFKTDIHASSLLSGRAARKSWERVMSMADRDVYCRFGS